MSPSDLLAEPSLVDWTPDSGHQTVPALRDALLDYRRIALFDRGGPAVEAPLVERLTRDVADLWKAHQASRFGYVAARLPWLLARAHASAESREPG